MYASNSYMFADPATIYSQPPGVSLVSSISILWGLLITPQDLGLWCTTGKIGRRPIQVAQLKIESGRARVPKPPSHTGCVRPSPDVLGVPPGRVLLSGGLTLLERAAFFRIRAPCMPDFPSETMIATRPQPIKEAPDNYIGTTLD